MRTTITHWTEIDSPLGPLTITGEDETVTGLFMVDHRHRPALPADAVRDDAPFADAATQLGEYFAGTRTRFDVPVRLGGTEFQQTVWMALRGIDHGETVTYGALAVRIGRPGASRAVGLANGRNPVSIIVPCHRVIGSDGSLTGYGGGLDRKLALLDLEARGRVPEGLRHPLPLPSPADRELLADVLADRATMPDGWLIGVVSTGIACRPECRPVRRPRPDRCRVLRGGLAEGRRAGLRACRLCRPDLAA